MAKSDLIRSYIRGDLDRRDFIRKLTVAGVSSGAAAIYATSLSGASAAPAGFNAAGFLAQTDPDEDYGVAIEIEDLLAALQAIIEVLQRHIARLEALLGLSASNGIVFFASRQDDSAQLLRDIQSQSEDHVDALAALFPELAVTSIDAGGANPVELADVAEDANLLAGLYAALLPNLDDPEQKQTLTEIAIVSGRHAAVLSSLAGINPVPAAFEKAIDPASIG